MINNKLRKRIAVLLQAALLLSLWPAGGMGYSGSAYAQAEISIPVAAGEVEAEPEAEAMTVHQSLGDVQVIPSENQGEKSALAAPSNGSWVSPAHNEILLYWSGLIGEGYSYEIYRDGERIGSSETLEFHDRGAPAQSRVFYEIFAVDDTGGRSEQLRVFAGTPREQERLLSKSASGIPGDGFVSEGQVAVSGDGLIAAFASTSMNLVEGTGHPDNGTLYVRNLSTSTIEAPLAGMMDAISDIRELSIDRNGSFIAFTAKSPSGERDVYLLDRRSEPDALTNVTNGDRGSSSPTLSGDAERILFRSSATNLNASGSEAGSGLYLFERETDAIEHLPVPTDGLFLSEPILSGDGRYAAYSLYPMDGNAERVLLYDLETRSAADTITVEPEASRPSMSNDGKRIAYQKEGSIHLWERATGTATTLLQLDSTVRYSDPRISGDGSALLAVYYDLLPRPDSTYTSEGLVWVNVSTGEQIRINHPASNAVGRLNESGSTVVYSGYYTGARDAYGFFRNQAMLQCVTTCDDAPPDGQGEPIDGVEWQASGSLRGQVKLGETLTITASGAAGGMAKATVTYQKHAVGSVTTEMVQADIALKEQESAPGVYAGSFPVDEGVTEITSITAVITDGEGRTGTRSAGLLPVRTTGTMTVVLPDVSDLPGQWRLLIWSAALSQGTQVAVDKSLQYSVALSAASDYSVQLMDENSRLIGEVSGIGIVSGKKGTIPLPIKERGKIASLLKNEKGIGIPDVRIIVRDEEIRVTEELLTNEQGYAETKGTYFEGETLYVSAAQQGYGSDSDEFGLQKIVLAAGSNEAAFMLDQSRNPVVTGFVRNEKGEPVPNATVLFNKKKLPYVSTVSDAEGRYSIMLRSPGFYQIFAQSESAPHYAGSGMDQMMVGDSNNVYDIQVSGVSIVQPRLLVKYLDEGQQELPIQAADVRSEGRRPSFPLRNRSLAELLPYPAEVRQA